MRHGVLKLKALTLKKKKINKDTDSWTSIQKAGEKPGKPVPQMVPNLGKAAALGSMSQLQRPRLGGGGLRAENVGKEVERGETFKLRRIRKEDSFPK